MPTLLVIRLHPVEAINGDDFTSYLNGLSGETHQPLAQIGANRATALAFSYRCVGGVPDHPHCVWTLLEGDADLSARWCAEDVSCYLATKLLA